MLRTMKELESLRIGASDGVIGSIKDFYFDDDAWVIRYGVVDTSTWLGGRDVLISPYAFGLPDFDAKMLPVSITKDQVRNSPSIDIHRPVSRQHETNYLGHYGYPNYWGGAGIWGEGAYPGAILEDVGLTGSDFGEKNGLRRDDDPHLRSCNAVKKYAIYATDGEGGHVQGYLIDERSLAIQYLIVNTSNWWLGHEVLIAPEWIEDVTWLYSKVNINLTREQIERSPAYDPSSLMNRASEEGLYRHYGRRAYWTTDRAPRAAA